jgi:hypothetical protein
MVAVAAASSTYNDIATKVRRLTASASVNTLSDADLAQYIQTYYTHDFPYSIKIDQMRSVYTFFTQPNVDRYPLDVNFNQGVRAPVYVEGIMGTFYKDRQQFYNVWPKIPTLFNPISGDGTTQKFNFTIPGPFLSKEVVLGGTDTNGNAISINDDGNGNLVYLTANPVVSLPASNTNPALPGMYNLNTGNPGLNNPIRCGTVNYVKGVFAVDFSMIAGTPGVTPSAGNQMTLWVSQYQVGRPYSLLFFNNELTVRPVPDVIYKVEVETYLTPIQFLQTTDNPILNQWWQLIAIGAAIKVLEDRQDMEGVQMLATLFDRQEALVLERQSVEEIFQPNFTIFNSSTPVAGGINGIGYWGW